MCFVKFANKVHFFAHMKTNAFYLHCSPNSNRKFRDCIAKDISGDKSKDCEANVTHKRPS